MCVHERLDKKSLMLFEIFKDFVNLVYFILWFVCHYLLCIFFFKGLVLQMLSLILLGYITSFDPYESDGIGHIIYYKGKNAILSYLDEYVHKSVLYYVIIWSYVIIGNFILYSIAIILIVLIHVWLVISIFVLFITVWGGVMICLGIKYGIINSLSSIIL